MYGGHPNLAYSSVFKDFNEHPNVADYGSVAVASGGSHAIEEGVALAAAGVLRQGVTNSASSRASFRTPRCLRPSQMKHITVQARWQYSVERVASFFGLSASFPADAEIPFNTNNGGNLAHDADHDDAAGFLFDESAASSQRQSHFLGCAVNTDVLKGAVNLRLPQSIEIADDIWYNFRLDVDEDGNVLYSVGAGHEYEGGQAFYQEEIKGALDPDKAYHLQLSTAGRSVAVNSYWDYYFHTAPRPVQVILGT